MIDIDIILHLVKSKGPVLPVHISKEVKQDLLFTSAMLSELVSKKKLKISYLKIGGSPLYFLPGQDDQLRNFINYINEQDKKLISLLEKKQVLRDSELSQQSRKSLRNIKDFAIPLQVTIGGNKELFWKWFLLNQQESTDKIKEMLGYQIPKKEVIEKPVIQEPKPEQKPVPKPQEFKPEKQEIVQESKSVVKRGRPKKVEETETQSEQIQEKPPEKPVETTAFLERLQAYFQASNISILHTQELKKNKEYDFILQLVSVVGPLQYYCKAKTAKRINEGDLSASFIVGQSKKLPTLYLSTGELTKKAVIFLEKELPGVAFKTIQHGS